MARNWESREKRAADANAMMPDKFRVGQLNTQVSSLKNSIWGQPNFSPPEQKPNHESKNIPVQLTDPNSYEI